MNSQNEMVTHVRNCQRCGQDHFMKFAPLTNPADEWDHWGMCPITTQPVLMRFVEETNAVENVATLQSDHRAD